MTELARRTVLAAGALALFTAEAHAQTDPLASWNEGAAKQAIVAFVKDTTTPGSPNFVPVAERIATFDQDGKLWVEKPMYSQVIYCLERVPAVVKARPELADIEPFKTAMSGNREAIARLPFEAAFGNSTGDREMLEYTKAGSGARLSVLVLHDDAAREYAYGPAQGLPESKVGTFTQALYDEAKKNGWTVISMKNDWKRIFAFD